MKRGEEEPDELRARALHDLSILEAPPSEDLKQLVRMIALVCDTPISFISLIDSERQHFMAKYGFSLDGTAREDSICTHTIAQDELYVVKPLEDPRFSDRPIFLREEPLQFYAGYPLKTEEGFNIGALCIADIKENSVDEKKAEVLKQMAHQVMCNLNTVNHAKRLKKTLDILHENDRIMRAVFLSIIDGVIISDAEGKIRDINPAGTKMFGYGSQELLGEKIAKLMPEKHRKSHTEAMASYHPGKLLQSKVIGHVVELQGLKKSGQQFPLELSVSHVKKHGESWFVGAVRDMTERKQTEVMRGEFISSVNHELRSPLTAIQGALGLLKHKTGETLPASERKLLDISYNNCLRLEELVNDIIDVEKIAIGRLEFRFETTEVGALIKELLVDYEGLGKKNGVTFRLKNRLKEKFYCDLDKRRFSQALVNYLSNAAKYSPNGGIVQIVIAPSDPGYVQISVADRGKGIPEEFRDKLFQKFSQAPNHLGGTGLGLSITKLIIESLGGEVGYAPDPNGGSLFYMVLPEAAAPPQA